MLVPLGFSVSIHAAPADRALLPPIVKALDLIDRDYIEPVDLDAVAARGVAAIRQKATVATDVFDACMSGRPAADRHAAVRAATILANAIECAQQPPNRQDELVDAALQAMVKGLDPYSAYVAPAELKALIGASDPGVLGISLTEGKEGFSIVSTFPESPARTAGLSPGDRILAIDGTSLAGKSLDQAVAMLRGAVNSDVALTLQTPGAATRELHLRRAPLGPGSYFEREVRDGILILHLYNLGYGVTDLLTRTLRQQPSALRGIVLDLRSNHGGLLAQAVGVADVFLGKGTIVVSHGRGKDMERYGASKEQAADGVPLVVVVNGTTLAGAEIIAAALQDNRRAAIVGETTFGAGTVQTLIPLDKERAIRLTTSNEYRPDGRRLRDAPVVPDCAAAPADALAVAVAVAGGDRSRCRPVG